MFFVCLFVWSALVCVIVLRNINLSVERFEIEKLDVMNVGCYFYACCGGLVCLLVNDGVVEETMN